ncbi:MAG: hypothetical protein CVT67_02910 [Actinobacteria bacterium HGW-Actinobacteria-7]|jgi:hypothetical protein|nr:MAG: hypothetical protein CVT67_02910 [Actinobacteria bacterium HGW-Actinobacteria-7]
MEPTVGHLAILEKVASDLALDLDGVQTLISDLKSKSAMNELDDTYTSRVINTVNASFARHLVALNEYGKAVEEAK